MTAQLVERGPIGSGLVITCTEGRQRPYQVMQIVDARRGACRPVGTPSETIEQARGHLAGLVANHEDSGKNYSY